MAVAFVQSKCSKVQKGAEAPREITVRTKSRSGKVRAKFGDKTFADFANFARDIHLRSGGLRLTGESRTTNHENMV